MCVALPQYYISTCKCTAVQNLCSLIHCNCVLVRTQFQRQLNGTSTQRLCGRRRVGYVWKCAERPSELATTPKLRPLQSSQNSKTSIFGHLKRLYFSLTALLSSVSVELTCMAPDLIRRPLPLHKKKLSAHPDHHNPKKTVKNLHFGQM